MKIAIIKLSSLGDIVHTMVVLQFIKKNYPESKIDWIVEKKFKEVLVHNPHINQIHTVNINDAKKNNSIKLFFREVMIVKSFGSYDLAIDFQGLIKTAIISRFLDSKKIIGFGGLSAREGVASFAYNQHVNIGYDQNTILRYLKLASEALSVNITQSDIENKKPYLFFKSKVAIPRKRYIVFVIGSTWESRNYPKEKFVEVANALKMVCVVIWGNDKEKNKAEWMEKRSDYIQSAPKLSLDQLKYIIQNASLLIGNDTGPSHMSWALNIPSILLFGPTPVERTFQTPTNIALKSSSKINHFKLNKNDFSIKEITVKDVVKIAKDLLLASS